MFKARGDKSEPVARLLVIEDGLIQRRIIAKLGIQAGFEVIEAATLSMAEAALRGDPFDCITLDLSLGDESGALLLRSFVDSGNPVPVIVISGAEAHVQRATVDIARSLNLHTELLEKPLKVPQLKEILSRMRAGVIAQRGLQRMAAANVR